MPGCDGSGDSGTDYCYARPSQDHLWKAGNNGVPAGAFPLKACESDCDSDADCEAGLVCFARSTGEAVPGCVGEGDFSLGEDVCFERPANFLWEVGNNGVPAEAFPLKACEGDCDNDSECAAGLACMQRSSVEPVPGCVGEEKSPGADICYDMNVSGLFVQTP